MLRKGRKVDGKQNPTLDWPKYHFPCRYYQQHVHTTVINAAILAGARRHTLAHVFPYIVNIILRVPQKAAPKREHPTSDFSKDNHVNFVSTCK